ncbi:MAG TPA: hypothetical protein VGG48_19115 [Rhizomicrobium sp.]|jgi:hypothetical protein
MALRAFICGGSETGKSTLARDLARAFQRKVILDCSGDYARRGFHVVTTLRDLSDYIAANYRRGFEVVYMPPTGKEALGLHHAADLIFKYQQRESPNGSKTLLVVVDEMAFFYSNAHAKSSELGGFMRLVNNGRHYGISVIGITQVPTSVALSFRTLCERKCIFSLHDAEAKKTILRTIGQSYERQLSSLRQYEFLDVVSADGQMHVTARKLAPPRR